MVIPPSGEHETVIPSEVPIDIFMRMIIYSLSISRLERLPIPSKLHRTIPWPIVSKGTIRDVGMRTKLPCGDAS